MPDMMKQWPVESVRRSSILREFDGFVNSRQVQRDLTQMKQTIEEAGLKVPPIVWKIDEERDDGDEPTYVLIDGAGRLTCIDAIVEEVEGAEATFEFLQCSIYTGDLDGALVENLRANVDRESLNPMDEADAVGRLMDRLGTQERVGLALGHVQGWVSTRLSLSRQLIQEGKDALRVGAIMLEQAKRLASCVTKVKNVVRPNVEKQQELLERMLAKKEAAERERGPGKKPRTIRSKDDLIALRKRLLESEDMDAAHQVSALTIVGWYFMEVSDEEVVHPQPRVIGGQAAMPDPEPEQSAQAEDDAPKKRRRIKQQA